MTQQIERQTGRAESEAPLATLFRHNLWANLRLLDACAALDEQQLAATTEGVYGSIYDTLNHIVRAERGYLNDLIGVPQGTPPPWEERPELPALRKHMRETGEGLIAAATAAKPTGVVHLQWDGMRWPIPAGMIFSQSITHSTEHRSQVLTILTQQGIEPPDLSGWAFIEAHVQPTPIE
ncbi:MAG: DinB family protein [Chloroflexota bacterium]